jgi:uroporphyrinogen III methyltransferase / synthase
VAIGKVYLVGAGPGDPGLITVRGAWCLSRAQVVIADHLVNAEILSHAPADAEVLVRPAGRKGALGEQEEINRLLVERALAGHTVVRLKGGDPFVFGRGSEEAEALVEAGVPFEVVPGVTAAIAAPAYAGIPITHRGLSGVVAFATGHEADDKQAGAVDWDAVARGAGTLVLYMSVSRLPDVVARLLAAGRKADEPAALVEWGTLPRQRTVEGTLGEIVALAEQAQIRPPALTIVGQVVSLRRRIGWFENRPLHGKRILMLATREEAELGDARGAQVTRVSPLTVIPHFAAVKTALARLAEMRVVAFASAHAVSSVVGALASLGRDGRALAGLTLCAVGEGTARALAEMHLIADLTARGGGRELAQEIIDAGLAGPVWVPRAKDGRDELAEALRAAGLPLEITDAYETVPDGTALGAAARAHRAQPFDAIGFASPRGARAFVEVLGGARLLDGVTLGTIGETTRAALAELGLSARVMPDHPSLPALFDSLCAALEIE